MNEFNKDKTFFEQKDLINNMHGHDLKELFESLEDELKNELLHILDNDNVVEL